jgi:hypothetical protein
LADVVVDVVVVVDDGVDEAGAVVIDPLDADVPFVPLTVPVLALLLEPVVDVVLDEAPLVPLVFPAAVPLPVLLALVVVVVAPDFDEDDFGEDFDEEDGVVVVVVDPAEPSRLLAAVSAACSAAMSFWYVPRLPAFRSVCALA